eukprot:CAMPEP_0114226262 /NCGR_PEP_ID=MMETSP0058-20121206/1141_1 /TAXON_ID=36894 /ORGANISM="Pyramimonas parkeae, CCMP726" /LENGTH=312 /DNA_ID=CAMNT_0001336981 /DNA_START=167 /DNA_END=1105 /DNA_ORIENTATION=-
MTKQTVAVFLLLGSMIFQVSGSLHGVSGFQPSHDVDLSTRARQLLSSHDDAWAMMLGHLNASNPLDHDALNHMFEALSMGGEEHTDNHTESHGEGHHNVSSEHILSSYGTDDTLTRTQFLDATLEIIMCLSDEHCRFVVTHDDHTHARKLLDGHMSAWHDILEGVAGNSTEVMSHEGLKDLLHDILEAHSHKHGHDDHDDHDDHAHDDEHDHDDNSMPEELTSEYLMSHYGTDSTLTETQFKEAAVAIIYCMVDDHCSLEDPHAEHDDHDDYDHDDHDGHDHSSNAASSSIQFFALAAALQIAALQHFTFGF